MKLRGIQLVIGFLAGSLISAGAAFATVTLGVSNTPSSGYLVCVDNKTKAVTYPGTLSCPAGKSALELGNKLGVYDGANRFLGPLTAADNNYYTALVSGSPLGYQVRNGKLLYAWSGYFTKSDCTGVPYINTDITVFDKNVALLYYLRDFNASGAPINTVGAYELAGSTAFIPAGTTIYSYWDDGICHSNKAYGLMWQLKRTSTFSDATGPLTIK